MFKSAICRLPVPAVVVILFATALLAAGTAVQAESITYKLIPFTAADYFDGSFTDTFTGTITAESGTYTHASSTAYLTASLEMTKTKGGTSTTISDGYSFLMSDFVRSGTAYFETDGIYLTKADTDLYLNRARNWGDPVVAVDWYAPGNRFIPWAGYQGTGATMKIDSSNAGAVFNFDATRWKIANAVNAPEPSSLILLALGLPGMAVVGWRRGKRR